MPLTRGQRRHASEAGQALIETALVLPLILILLFIVIDFGIALDRREVILHSLREAGRSAAAGGSLTAIVNRAVAESDGVVEPGDVTVCYDDANTNDVADAGEVGHISINYEYTLTVGSGEMLTGFGVPKPTVDISPSAEVLLMNGAPGVPSC
jgi:Flp pilus assembly protein TadG